MKGAEISHGDILQEQMNSHCMSRHVSTKSETKLTHSSLLPPPSRMWWTITGNFGNILPIDWSKSYSRQMHIPALNLADKKSMTNGEATDDELNDLSSEDEAVAQDLDMHALILGGVHSEQEPIKTAEEVMKEIDEIMDETESEVEYSPECEAIEKAQEVLKTMLYPESES